MTDKVRTVLAARFSLRAVSFALLGCLFGATLLAPSTPARAADDGDKNVPIDTRIMRGIMKGLGLRQDGEAINYEERAPLVIPPSRALPPPENPGAAVANNPAWPIDPDVKRAKEEAAQERRANASRNADQVIQSEASPLREDQLTPGPKPRGKRIGDDGYRPSPNGSGGPLTPEQLGNKRSIFSRMFAKDAPESSSFTGEPPRTALTEPPSGYQTPSPDQPYGVGKKAPPPNTTADYLMNHPVGSQ